MRAKEVARSFGPVRAQEDSPLPRWLSVDAAASYLSMPVDSFRRLVRGACLPAASRALGDRWPRWDRLALDARMLGETRLAETRDEMMAGVVAEIYEKGRIKKAARERRVAEKAAREKRVRARAATKTSEP